MRQKSFSKKQVRAKIKKVLKVWKSSKLQGRYFPLTSVLGNYRDNSMNRFIKETLFYNIGDSSPLGATWFLKWPKTGSKKLTKRVMKSINITR